MTGFKPIKGQCLQKVHKGSIKKNLGRLFNMLKSYKVSLFIILVAVVISTVMSIMAPVFLYKFMSREYIQTMFNFDTITNTVISINIRAFVVPFVLIGLSYVFSALFSFIAEYITSRMTGQVCYDLRKEIKSKIDTLPLSYFDQTTYGDILSRVTNDTDTISTSLQQMITQLIRGVIQIIGVIVAMFVVSWQLALIAIGTIPFALLISFTIAMRSQKMFVAQQRLIGELNGQIEEVYSGFKIIKLFNKEEDVNKHFEDSSYSLSLSGRKAMFMSGLIQPLLNLVNNICYVAICVVGGLLKAFNAIAGFFIFLTLFQEPIRQIAQIANVIQQAAAASGRIFEVLDAKEEEADDNDAIEATGITGRVEFNNVDFSYDPNIPLIENLNLKIEPGDSIAIVGPTGAGKTTLVNLVMRFYDITGGKLTVDGISIDRYQRASLRKNIGMVLQDTWLFNGSIAENIAYGNMEASREEIIKAAKEAKAHHFISTLPQGYDTIMNEEANNISQGQKQLLTIARAILSNPKIMILDEATSSVDTRTEKALQEAMNSIMKDRTSFVIAHRLSTIKNAKTIIVMNHGHIVEQGNHRELMALNGFYAELYNAQFTGAKEERK